MQVRSFEDNRRSFPGVERFNPTRDAKAPAISGFQSGEIVFWHGRGEVITACASEGEKLYRHHCANGVQPPILRTSSAVTVAIEASARDSAATLQRLTEDIAGHT